MAQTMIKGPGLIEGTVSTATAAGTTTLTKDSQTNQTFTGVTTQTVVLPDATTLPVGRRFYITNRSTGIVTVNTNGGALLATIAPDYQRTFIVKTIGSAAGTWDVSNVNVSGVTGILPIANGGTNKALTLSAGGVPYFDADSFEVLNAGSSGQLLASGGAGAPSWTTATYPSAAGTSGTILQSNGTNWVNTTATYPGVATSAGTILRADGTNWLATTATFPNTTTINQILYSSANNVVGGITAAATSALVTNSSSVPAFTSGATPNRLLRTDGTTISFAQAALTTDVTGILPMANGGTNKNMTAINGGIIWSDADSQEVTAAGTSGQWLQSGGAATPIWVGSVSVKTSDYTLTVADDVVIADVTSGTVILSLPTAVGIQGKRFTLKSINNTSSNVTGISTSGSQSIDGWLAASSRALRYHNDFMTVESDGANWKIISSNLSPTVQTFTSGTGTYTTSAFTKFIVVTVVGGGGGGQASNTAAWGNAGNTGNASTFGSSLLTANGGAGGNVAGGLGGTFTVSSPAVDIGSMRGGAGGSGTLKSTSNNGPSGFGGGSPYFGGGALNVLGNTAGATAITNSGGGGSGGGLADGTAGQVGAGGGSGATVRALINTPSATYSYAVGASVNGGTAGTQAGGASAAGMIIVEEYK